jgi:predicted MFS family arabinose efflux permease
LSVLGPIVGGILVLALFVWYESRIDHPALNVRLFKDPRLSASVGAITLVFFGMSGVFFFISIYLQSVRDYSPLEAGLLTLPFAIAQLIFSPRSAAMVARFGAKATTTTGLIVVLIAILSYQLAGTHSPIWMLEISFFLQGAGMANVMPPATNSVMSALPREQAGSGSALTNVSRQVAVALGVAILGSVVSSVYREEMTPHLAGLPKSAGDSIGATAGIAEKLHLPADRLVDYGHTAFVDGMHLASGISAVIALAGVLVVLKWMPGRVKTDPVDSVSAEQPATAVV